MARCTRVIAVLALFGAPMSRLTAQSVAEPMAVAQRFLNAVRTSDWETALQLTDANSIWEWATLQRASLRPQQDPEMEPETVETMMRRDSTLPRAVAEYFVSQRAKHVDRPELGLAMQYADVRTQAQFDSLSDGDLYTRHIRANSFAYLHEILMEQMGCKASPLPPATGTDDVLGVALLRDGKAIALYIPAMFNETKPPRDDDMDFAIRRLRLLKTPAGWRVLASSSGMNEGGLAIGLEGGDCQKK